MTASTYEHRDGTWTATLRHGEEQHACHAATRRQAVRAAMMAAEHLGWDMTGVRWEHLDSAEDHEEHP